MKVFAFVPAKGTSERVENKNMRFLDGDPLFIRSLKILLECKEIDKVFLDTESDKMREMVSYLPIEHLKRDTALANNKTDGHQMLINEVNSFPEADIYVQLLCTSPFIKAETIDKAIRKLKEDSSFDSAVLMKKDKFYFWDKEGPLYNKEHIPNSVDLPETLIESMGLYIIRKETALKNQRRFGDKPYFIFGGLEELIDVNTHEDLEFAKNYAKGLKQQENSKLRLIKHFISSPALSDLLDDIYIETGEVCGQVMNDFKSNIAGVKLLGHANTLRLRALKENEPFEGIYQALEQYNNMTENDIIVVENELSEFAYFGDLNARLAIRSGASGAIVNGASRDVANTAMLNFPVFAKSYNAADVRRRATFDYMNKPIYFGDVKITPGDLIFIDECSMVVIYKNKEKIVLERALATLSNENSIVNDIWLNKEVDDIVKKRGYF